ncbi:MAG: hypothetical protein NT175_03390 [Bacteroidetes bacterium]|nr:hypothetical protein [Bacteroidota bacterium]
MEHNSNGYHFAVAHSKDFVAFGLSVTYLMFFKFALKNIAKIIDRAKNFYNFILWYYTSDSR